MARYRKPALMAGAVPFSPAGVLIWIALPAPQKARTTNINNASPVDRVPDRGPQARFKATLDQVREIWFLTSLNWSLQKASFELKFSVMSRR
jgi:hypothetical protein